MPSLGYEPYDGCEVCAVSLGICAVRAAIRPDLRGRLSASDRERPLFTGVNGPLMPGDPSPTCADRVLCSFPRPPRWLPSIGPWSPSATRSLREPGHGGLARDNRAARRTPVDDPLFRELVSGSGGPTRAQASSRWRCHG